MPEPHDEALFVWTAGRGGLRRFVAHVLIRLLILGPLPPYAQLTAALFPASLLWPLLASAAPEGGQEKAGSRAQEEPAVSRLSEWLGAGWVVAARGVWEPGMTGVGSKLALTDDNLLLSVYQTLINGTDPRGLHATALDRVALIERIKPKRVVVDLAKKAAESFEVAYRVIPSSTEIQSSQLELRAGDATLLTRPAPLAEGRGAIALGVGTDLGQPGVGVRLVLNAGTPEELIGLTRRVSTARVAIQPSEPIELTTDDREVELVAYSDSHLERTSDAEAAGLPRETTQLIWEVVGGGGTLSLNPSASNTGVFETRLLTPQTPGATYGVQVRLPGSGVVAVSEPVTVETGRARQMALSSDRPALPADSASEATLTLSNVRDQFGNVVPDGTQVSWAVEGQGELELPTSATSGGVTTMKYRAGTLAGDVVITAQVGDARGTTVLSALFQKLNDAL